VRWRFFEWGYKIRTQSIHDEPILVSAQIESLLGYPDSLRMIPIRDAPL
jgi:hypothetical protein